MAWLPPTRTAHRLSHKVELLVERRVKNTVAYGVYVDALGIENDLWNIVIDRMNDHLIDKIKLG